MSYRHRWVIACCVLLAACGGRDVGRVYGTGGDATGGSGTTQTSGTATSGTATSGTATSGTATSGTTMSTVSTGTGVTGTGPGTGSSGVTGAGGSIGTGSTTGAGGFGGGGPCGPVLCAPGLFCCNPSCGICVLPGQGCPLIGCGTGGSTGAGGFGGSSACGTLDVCMAQLSSTCRERAGCTCGDCPCEVHTCESDPGCQQILACALKTNCTGRNCYLPSTCKAVIDGFGGTGSLSFRRALDVDTCSQRFGCSFLCGSVDAGVACILPPPPVGGQISCSGGGSIGGSECSEDCTDLGMNSYVAKCVNRTCTCFYDGKQTCTCSMTSPNGICRSCCPGWTSPP
jgi:hypothetical protein